MRGRKAGSSLAQSQKKLYLAVKKELAPFEKRKRQELRSYERAFRQGMPHKVRASKRAALLAAIGKARVILVGDFHPFRESQKGFMRLVEGSAKPGGRAVIALECFHQRHQPILDQFVAGLITAEELREETNFDLHWPFPWENYREILRLARVFRLPVIALNVPGKLRARDTAAAARIALQLALQPNAAVFALFGELHLGRTHLPRALRTTLGARAALVIVHQNDPECYWRAPTLADGQKPEVVRLGAAEFCILNSVPWVKLRSYLDWLEGSPAPDLEDDQLDAAGLVYHYARLLADTTGISVRLDDGLEILPPDRLSRRGPAFRALASPDRELAAHALQFRRTGYLPRYAAVVLPTVSTNSMLEAATYLLRHSLRPANPPSRWGSDEYMCHFFIGYLGSKLLNPKRKCDETADLRRRAGAQDAIASRALALLAPFLKREKLRAGTARLAGARELEAARSAGFVLGERYFQALLRRTKSLEELRKMLTAGESRAFLRAIAKRIAEARVAPASKGEKF